MDVKCKTIFLKNILVMIKHMVSVTINNLKAILKNGGIPSKILIAHQQPILGYKTWYQINAMS